MSSSIDAFRNAPRYTAARSLAPGFFFLGYSKTDFFLHSSLSQKKGKKADSPISNLTETESPKYSPRSSLSLDGGSRPVRGSIDMSRAPPRQSLDLSGPPPVGAVCIQVVFKTKCSQSEKSDSLKRK